MKNVKFLIILLIVAAITRLSSVYFFGDKQISNEWGIMVDSLENYGILASRNINGQFVPNIFMPPLYAYFLYSFKIFFKNLNLFLSFIFFLQALMGLISCIIFYKILLNFFSIKLSRFGTFFFTLFPLNIYETGQISSAGLQLFLSLVSIFFFFKLFKKDSLKNILFFSIPCGLMLLLRGEFFIIFFFFLTYFFFKKKNILKIFLSLFFVTIIISPYVYRNYKIFEIFTLTKSSGFNLFKGNNPLAKVEGYSLFYNYRDISNSLADVIDRIEPQNKYDLIIDEILFEEAIKNIKENKSYYFKLYLQKFFAFIVIDFNSSYPKYYNFFHIFPKILLSISTLIGIAVLLYNKQFLNFFLIYFIINVAIFSFFFILPRYSLSLLPIQIIISLEAIKFYFKKKVIFF